MNRTKPCVLVYNPISGHGHLDSWNAMFVTLLLQAGWRVLALTPDADALRTRLQQRAVGADVDLVVLDWNAPLPVTDLRTLRSRLRQLWLKWDKFGDRFYYRRNGSEATDDMSFFVYWRTRLFQLFVPTLFSGSHFFYARYRRWQEARKQARSTTAKPQVANDPEDGFLEPTEFAGRICAALRNQQDKPDLVFNMYMDMYRTDAARWGQLERCHWYPWTGIRFVPAGQPFEAYYQVKSLLGMCFLDDTVCEAYRRHFNSKRFAWLPDITDAALPDSPGEFALMIRERAGARNVVFMGGSIGGQKNLARWFEVIRVADPDLWFFVQLGELHVGTLTSEDREALAEIEAAPPENLFLHKAYVPDERVFNEIISISDVIFAVYRNFRISSNMLGKAAAFRKPILVSDRYLLGAQVTRYGIGAAVAEDDASAILAGLQRLADAPVPIEHFERYLVEHSEQNLKTRLDAYLRQCLSNRATGAFTARQGLQS